MILNNYNNVLIPTICPFSNSESFEMPFNSVVMIEQQNDSENKFIRQNPGICYKTNHNLHACNF
jgi:hypothetical protein